MSPVISVVMPNYNGARFLRRAINTFLRDDYLKKELIIIDGKSTDESHAIISSYVDKHSHITWSQEEDQGISDAINKGIMLSKGDIIGYLGSDDLLNNGTLKKVSEYKQLVDFDGIYFDSYTYYVEEDKIQLRKCPVKPFDKSSLLSYGTIVGLQNIFFDKRVFVKHQFDVNNKYSMDYDLYFRILDDFSCFVHVEHPASINLFHENISNKLVVIQEKEAVKVMLKYAKISDIYLLPFKRIFKSLIQ